MSVRVVMGGTFDPIHRGHLELAEGIRRALGLGTLWLMPTANPPHKSFDTIQPAEHRIAMVWAALHDYPALAVCTLETGSQVSYTLDSMRRLKRESPHDAPVFVLGMDSVVELPTWDRWRQLLEEFDLIAIRRPDLAPLDPASMHLEVADRLQPVVDPESATDLIEREQLGSGGRIFPLELPTLEIASRDIRRRVREGEPLDDLVAPGVARYIRDHDLYRKGGPEH